MRPPTRGNRHYLGGYSSSGLNTGLVNPPAQPLAGIPLLVIVQQTNIANTMNNDKRIKSTDAAGLLNSTNITNFYTTMVNGANGVKVYPIYHAWTSPQQSGFDVPAQTNIPTLSPLPAYCSYDPEGSVTPSSELTTLTTLFVTTCPNDADPGGLTTNGMTLLCVTTSQYNTILEGHCQNIDEFTWQGQNVQQTPATFATNAASNLTAARQTNATILAGVQVSVTGAHTGQEAYNALAATNVKLDRIAVYADATTHSYTEFLNLLTLLRGN